jgi:hypothetical protein
MGSTEQITYREMCEAVAQDWNREQEAAKGRGAKDIIFLTADDIWNFRLVQKFPALYVPRLYDAAKTGDLMGLILTDNTCAKMFFDHLYEAGKKEE